MRSCKRIRMAVVCSCCAVLAMAGDGNGGELRRFVSDTLYVNQWPLAGFGVHINMADAWDWVTGKGIVMTIADDGIDLTHEDLLPNAFPLASGFHRNFADANTSPTDPSPQSPAANHGTRCAGLAAAAGFNDRGVIGVAPEAGVIGLRLFDGVRPAAFAADSPISEEAIAEALTWQPPGLVTHVSIQNWGPADDGRDPGRLGGLALAALETAATENRRGLGTVLVTGGGDGRAFGDDSAYDAFASSRFALAIGAVNREGEPSSYSENGMNLAVSAPGGEPVPFGSLWTTTNAPPDSPLYTDSFHGTAAAASQVAGAVALLLERNPALGYRDVKEILMRSARREGLTGGDEFATNAGGFAFSHSFGAGLLNVAGALSLAVDWTNLGPLLTAHTSNHAPLAIPDNPATPLVRQMDLYGGQPLRVEHVELTVTIQHARRGDLSLTIVSPSGMQSVAASRPNDDGADLLEYTFTSVRHWGETSTGMWRVLITDTNANGIFGELLDVHLRLYGTAAR